LGIGFVLLFWAVIFGGAAVVSAVVLGLWSLWNHRAVIGRREVLKAVAAAALPILMFGYGGAAFVGYAVWCETLRGVDPGIGDVWRVPVGKDHYFCMIDVPEEGYLLKAGWSGAPIVHGITEPQLLRRLGFRSQQIERGVSPRHPDRRFADLHQHRCRRGPDCAAADSAERQRLLHESTLGKGRRLRRSVDRDPRRRVRDLLVPVVHPIAPDAKLFRSDDMTVLRCHAHRRDSCHRSGELQVTPFA
jgi:hypothetical protein